MAVPSGPGLGVAVDPLAVERYRVGQGVRRCLTSRPTGWPPGRSPTRTPWRSRAASGTWTAAALDGAADRPGRSPGGAGRAAGCRVAALLEDDAPAVAAHRTRLRRLGAVLAAAQPTGGRAELIAQLRAATPGLLVTTRRTRPRAASWPRARASPPPRSRACSAVLAASPARTTPPPVVDLDAPATIVFTSGTTGRPRGGRADARQPRRQRRRLGGRPRAAPGRSLAGLPAALPRGRAGHRHARQPLGRPARGPAPLRRRRRRRAHRRRAAATCRSCRRSSSSCSTAWDGRPVPATLRAILLGGAPIPVRALARARAVGLPVLTTYGMTETASGVAVGGAGRQRRSPTRLPCGLCRVSACAWRDPDRPTASGSILVRGPMVFGGYLGDAAATAERLADGWLRTGDLGSLDERRAAAHRRPPRRPRHLRRRERLPGRGRGGPARAPGGRRGGRRRPGRRDLGQRAGRRHRRGARCVRRRRRARAPLPRAAGRLQGARRASIRLLALPRNEAGKVLRRELRELLAEAPA